ncbi:glycosyltransferase BC10-like isoform X1 [Primulina huaijiensis]|uniref:glycosyltransferase BC10-like isoform X1 n=1 Tax=Primulina huaijiensis TaxID=1492673 RepID=UPI003CC74B96
MKRSSNPQKFHHRWKRKLLSMLLCFSCFAIFLLMESLYSPIQMLSPPTIVKPKIACLFIARNRIPLDMVWDAFFRGDGENRFSIYVHSRPGFLLNKATTRSPYFLYRQINDSIQVDWGEASMIQAERILLQNALMHPLNERFIFLSDSCIPLYNFSYVYDYIMSTSTSFVDSSFADTKEGRYNPKMDPVIPVDNWRKGSQWVILTRKHAEIVVQDDSVFPMFQWHCKKRSLPEFWRELSLPADASKEHNCIPDEHYVQTLLAQKGLEGEITRRSLTHSSWDLSSSKDPERRGWHPLTYKLADTSPVLIQSIKTISITKLSTEENGALARENPLNAFFLRGNLHGLLLYVYLTRLFWEYLLKQQLHPEIVSLRITSCGNHIVNRGEKCTQQKRNSMYH